MSEQDGLRPTAPQAGAEDAPPAGSPVPPQAGPLPDASQAYPGPQGQPPWTAAGPYRQPSAPPPFRRACSRVGLAFVVMMLCFVLGQLGLLVLLRRLWPGLFDGSVWLWLCTDLPLYGLGAPLYWLVLRGLIKKLPKPARPARYARMTPAWAGRLFCLGELLMITGSLVSGGILKLLEFWLGLPAQNPVAEVLERSSMLANLIFTVLVAAIGEELLFRELLYRALAPYGERPYLLLSAGLFALFHGNLSQIPYAFLVGLLFAWVRCRTGRVGWGMLLHGAINFCGGILPFLILDSLVLTAIWGWTVLGLCVLGGIYLFRLRAPRRLRGALPKPVPACGPLPPHPVRAALLNLGMLAAFVCSAALVLFTILSELGAAM